VTLIILQKCIIFLGMRNVMPSAAGVLLLLQLVAFFGGRLW
jgi:hypothetical protein